MINELSGRDFDLRTTITNFLLVIDFQIDPQGFNRADMVSVESPRQDADSKSQLHSDNALYIGQSIVV